jgi:hypothetical protein
MISALAKGFSVSERAGWMSSSRSRTRESRGHILAALARVLDGELAVPRAIDELMAHPARAEVDADHLGPR